MNIKKFLGFFKEHKVFFALGSSVTVLLITISLINFAKVVYASYASWGNTSLVHGCLNDRGGVTIVASTDTCKTNETQVTFLKDVDAGSGISITRDSGGATISLASTSEDGWVDAGENWTYASADDPTYTFTVSGDVTTKYSPGMRVKLTQTTEKYFLITVVSYSSPNTTVTVYGGTDYDLANATISNPYFSTNKAPYGFPLNPAKWTVEVNPTNSNQGSPTANIWYNPGSTSITVPIGAWDLAYVTGFGFDRVTASNNNAHVTLSTANNSESDSAMTSKLTIHETTRVGTAMGFAEKFIDISSETTYYLNIKTTYSSAAYLYLNPVYIRAVSSYL